MSPPRNNRGLYLSECHDLAQIVRVRCNFCRKPERYYEPKDMIELLGDAEVDRLRGRLKCEDCGRQDWTDVGKRWRDQAIREGLCVRRLVRIDTIRRPVWRDERL